MGEAAGAVAGGISGLAGSYIQGEAAKSQAETAKRAATDVAGIQADTAKRQLEFDKQQAEYAKQIYGEQSAAYKQAYQNAQNSLANAGNDLNNLYSSFGNNLSTGYNNLQSSLMDSYKNALNKAGETPQEIETLRNDILSGNARQLSQGRNELAAALSASGVRGGQAATQMRRGIGEQTQSATENINQLMSNQANQSKAYQQALLASMLGSQQQLGMQQLGSQQQLTQQQLADLIASKRLKESFLYSPESSKYAK